MTWQDVTFAGVYWNDPVRVNNLLGYASEWFEHIVVGVQLERGDGPDPTYVVADKWAERVITDHVQGYCEPTLNKVLQQIRTPWTLVVSADEWPSELLLEDMQSMLDVAAAGNDYTPHDGFWIRFRSSIDGFDFLSEQDNHLRLFRTSLGWPPTLHSRPPAMQTAFWRPEAYISHDRSLDEMMQDYLRYWREGRGNAGWEAHNKVMMHDACAAIAERRGWDYVQAFPWWPDVKAIAFPEEK